jgi:hypothetical protein
MSCSPRSIALADQVPIAAQCVHESQCKKPAIASSNNINCLTVT